MANRSGSIVEKWMDVDGLIHVKVTSIAQPQLRVLQNPAVAGTGKRKSRRPPDRRRPPLLDLASLAPSTFHPCPVSTCYRNTRFGCELSHCGYRDRATRKGRAPR